MQQILNALIQFLQQGLSAIFKFFQLIYNWAFEQILRLSHVPFSSWPVWKQVLTAIAGIAILGLLIRAGKELWGAGEAVLAAFATLLRVLVHILPWVLMAGLVAFVVLLVVNNVNL